jgi:hypothetical protein
MKKIITSILTVALMYGASAQTSSGNILIDGSSSFSFNSMKNADSKSTETNIDLGLTGGYFVIDGLAVGLGINLLMESSKPDGGDADKSSITMISPMARYYVGDIGVWGQISYGFGSASYDGEKAYSVSNLGISAGYAIFLNDNISLNPTLGYNMMSTKMEGADDKSKDAGIAAGITIAVHL